MIDQLVSEWSPPEWIEFEVSMSGEMRISGNRWRLNVTYDGESYRILNIHTPYARRYSLTRNDRRKAP